MEGKYVAPKLTGLPNGFTCPNCQTLASQQLINLAAFDVNHRSAVTHKYVTNEHTKLGDGDDLYRLVLTACTICKYRTLWALPMAVPPQSVARIDPKNKLHSGDLAPVWQEARIIYPVTNTLPHCNEDAPKKAIKIYNEAATVLAHSKRAAAALIRVASEVLLQEVFKTDQKLNSIIENHRTNLGDFYATAHALRLIGNDGAHPIPEAIDLDEDVSDIVESLFILFNEMTEELISRKKRHSAAMEKIARKSGKPIPGIAVQSADGSNDIAG